MSESMMVIRRSEARRGLGLVEALAALVILSLAFAPLLTATTATSRQIHLSDRHVVAAARARSLLDLAGSIDFHLLDWIAGSAAKGGRTGGADIDADADVELDLALIFDQNELSDLLSVLPRPDPRRQGSRADPVRFDDRVTYRRLSHDLGRVGVRVSWNGAPGGGAEGSAGGARPPSGGSRRGPHQVALFRLVHRPEASFRVPAGGVRPPSGGVR
jgi:hypothetical protein